MTTSTVTNLRARMREGLGRRAIAASNYFVEAVFGRLKLLSE
jgi:hypothetical protein